MFNSSLVKIQRLEMLLRDRENISAHAKEMWMAESTRAAKLAESLERAEYKIQDLEKNLSELSITYAVFAQLQKFSQLLQALAGMRRLRPVVFLWSPGGDPE